MSGLYGADAFGQVTALVAGVAGLGFVLGWLFSIFTILWVTRRLRRPPPRE